MAKVRLNIDGRPVEAEETETVLEVVRRTGLADIPTLCHHPAVEPFTACWLCVVEVKGEPRPVPSCATRVREGMEVVTESEELRRSRRANLELLLSDHFADCHPPCRIRCPAHVDIQGYIALASRGRWLEAQMLMRETNAFPMVCGRVCARPCEDACRRNHVDRPVDIRNIKRFIADRDLEDPWVPPVPEATGKRVAVVGAGPAGLSCAYFLRRKGHAVTVFERMPEPGGMLRYGIPEYRLPKADLAKEIGVFVRMGVEIRCGVEWGKDVTIDGLMAKGYDAVFVAVGCQRGSRLRVEGEEAEGVMQGVEFLRRVNAGERIALCGRVLVVGGGNTAIDAARTALRLGASEVTVLYRRTEAEMPANREEVEDAKAEGVRFRFLTAPCSYVAEAGRLKAVNLVRMELGEPDASGRRRPVVVEGSATTEPVDFVVEAVGQALELPESEGLELDSRGTIRVKEGTYETSRRGVFAGGDAVSGPDIVIGAVAQGREAAFAIDLFLKGEEPRPERMLGFHVRKEDFRPVTPADYASVPKRERNAVVKLPPEERVRSFAEVELGLTPEGLAAEAARCLECGCQDLHECRLRRYAERYAAGTGRFAGAWRGSRYESGHRFLAFDTAKCVTCGLCERVCREVQKQAVFSFWGRGFGTLVVPPRFLPLAQAGCVSCGACVAVCPTGAITERLAEKPGPFETEVTASHCGLCGDACEVALETRGGVFVKVSSPRTGGYAWPFLCFRGRFGHAKAAAPASARPLREILGRYGDGQGVVLSLSPRLTLEELGEAVAFAAERGWSVASWELASRAAALGLLAERGVGNEAPDLAGAERVVFVGRFEDERNSVSFRRFVRDDGRKDLVFERQLTRKYLRHRVVGPEGIGRVLAESDRSRTLVVCDLWSVPEETLAVVLRWAGPEARGRVYLFHWTVNLEDALRLVGTALPRRREVRTVISVNEPDGAWAGWGRVVRVRDWRDGGSEALLPFWRKSGTVRDQEGRVKAVRAVGE